MKKFDLSNPRTLASTGIMTALVLGLTLIHIATTGAGYVHLGDIAVYFASFAFGPWVGLVAGGVGAALADAFSGYPQFALLSLVVHGLQGYVAGMIVRDDPRLLKLILAVVAGAVIVFVGYFLGEYFIGPLGGPAQAIADLTGNVVQELFGALGIVVYLGVARAYPRIRQNDV
jgi:uncharacterized membrane protein